MRRIELPAEAGPSERGILLVRAGHPGWSLKEIARFLGYRNPERPRRVQQVMAKYEAWVSSVETNDGSQQ